jgi:hypothetical protein
MSVNLKPSWIALGQPVTLHQMQVRDFIHGEMISFPNMNDLV